MAKGITLKDKNGGTLYPKTVADLVLDSETGEPIGEVYTKNIKADKNGRLLVTEGDKRYFVGLTELFIPDFPTLAETKYNVVTGDCSIKVTPHPTGATMEYKIVKINDIDYSDTWKQITSDTFKFATGYTNNNDNKQIELTIKLRAEKNGEVSDEVSATIYITPQVASGSVSVARNNKNSDWSTEATITLSPSPTTGAKSEYYSKDKDSWTVFSGTTTIYVSTSENVPDTIAPGTYKVRATKEGSVYEKAEEAQNGGFTIGARKAYYGFSSNGSLNNLSDITSLETTGGVLEAHKLNTKTTYYIYPSKSGSTKDGYIWLCCKDSLIPGKIFSDAEAIIPFGFIEAEGISGYKCYRSENLLSGNENLTIYIKD
jgi:hypothetical protein